MATDASSLATLPTVLRDALQTQHSRGTDKHAAGVPWSAEMDAWVLVRHIHDGVPLAKLADEGPAIAAGRTVEAIKTRWKRRLANLPGLEALRDAESERPSAAAATVKASTLPPWLYERLVRRHAGKQPTKSAEARGKAWNFDEDLQILECHHAGAKLSDLHFAERKWYAAV